jgi:PilZ domain
MNHQGDRRAAGTTRVPFDALVEVGGELGPSFEAQAIDISEEGMHLRTAYLPEIGQPLLFRFDAGPDRQIAVQCEVTWKQEEGKGGEFGARFTGLDDQAIAALGRILGLGGPPPQQAPGSRVRLHIEGLASPMRARVKVSSGTEITAFSELGFLQVGKQLELEDAQSGAKRPACIDRVDVEVDKETRVPQLVVTLRYDDVPAHAVHEAEAGEVESEEEASSAEAEEVAVDERAEHEAPEQSAPAEDAHPPAEAHAAPASPQPAASEDASIEEASGQMRGAIARGAAKVGPAFAAMMTRAKVTMALLAAKRRGGSKDDVAVPIRRTTAPPPGGALHASGRKVVRSDPELDAMKEEEPVKRLSVAKRRAIVGGAVGIAVLLAFVALKKPAPQTPLAAAPPPEAAPNSVPIAPAPLNPASDPLASTMTSPAGPPDPMSLSPSAKDDKEAKSPKKKIAPFGNGPVAHGNTLHLKMDGAIEKLEGAQQPTGFTVVIPSRRSLEPAGPLASRDSRIASIHVSNEASGAELTVAFKDGVPNYQVRAHGDTLEIALAPIGQVNDGKTGGTHSVQAKHHEGAGKPHGKNHQSGAIKPD